MVSVIIPARNERFLVPTVKDILAKATGPIEVIAVLDGYWPNPPLPEDKRLRILHRGESLGMRPAINDAARVASGDYLLKCDGHTSWDVGFDEKLKAHHHDDNWIQVPRRFALEPESWTLDTSNSKYPIDAHYLSNPLERVGDPTCGLHGTPWTERRGQRKDILLDEEMSSQGSGWFMKKSYFDNQIGPLDIARYGSFVNEFQEVGLRCWLSGGSVMVNKHTFYSHLYKGKRYGRGFVLGPNGHKEGVKYTSWFWMTDQPFKGRTRSLRWLVERFAPVPTWPSDLDELFHRARAVLKSPYALQQSA